MFRLLKQSCEETYEMQSLPNNIFQHNQQCKRNKGGRDDDDEGHYPIQLHCFPHQFKICTALALGVRSAGAKHRPSHVPSSHPLAVAALKVYCYSACTCKRLGSVRYIHKSYMTCSYFSLLVDCEGLKSNLAISQHHMVVRTMINQSQRQRNA